MMKDDDFKLLRGFGDKQTDRQTFVIVESLLQLKLKFANLNNNPYQIAIQKILDLNNETNIAHN